MTGVRTLLSGEAHSPARPILGRFLRVGRRQVIESDFVPDARRILSPIARERSFAGQRVLTDPIPLRSVRARTEESITLRALEAIG